jgi:hypothetical protein
MNKLTTAVMLSVHSLRLPIFSMKPGEINMLKIKNLAPCVMQSGAKHPCIYTVGRIQGFFVAFGFSE